jgi:hypothetical protein
MGVLFGSLGLVLAIAALVGVWVLSQRVTHAVDVGASALTEFTQAVHDRAGVAGGRVRESRERVELLQNRLDEALEGQELDPVKMRAGLAELQGYAEEINEWIALAGSTQDLVVLLDGVLGSVEAVAGAEGRSAVATEMAGGALKVKEASVAFAELREALDEIQAIGEEPNGGAQVKPLLTRCADLLGQLEASIGGFSESVERAEDAVEQFSETLRFKIHLAAWVASVLLVWQGAGQYCLARWGLREGKRGN